MFFSLPLLIVFECGSSEYLFYFIIYNVFLALETFMTYIVRFSRLRQID